MTGDPIKHVTFPESVLRRPGMYTISGSFVEAIAFLEGYYGALAKVDPYLAQVQEWQSFSEWLSAKLGVSTIEVFRSLLESRGDADALSSILEFLREYQNRLTEYEHDP